MAIILFLTVGYTEEDIDSYEMSESEVLWFYQAMESVSVHTYLQIVCWCIGRIPLRLFK